VLFYLTHYRKHYSPARLLIDIKLYYIKNLDCKMLKHFSHFMVSYRKDIEHKWVLSLVWHVRNDFQDVTSDGRLFWCTCVASFILSFFCCRNRPSTSSVPDAASAENNFHLWKKDNFLSSSVFILLDFLAIKQGCFFCQRRASLYLRHIMTSALRHN